jgi:hypothetical protein
MSVAPTRRLDGWKAIATYLGRNERTAQRWAHARGMPLHHVPGGRSGTVFAYESELDRWLQDGPPAKSAASQPGAGLTTLSHAGTGAELETAQAKWVVAPQAVRPRRLRQRAWLGVALLVASVAGAVVLSVHREPPVISSLEIDGETLKARDTLGRVAWRYKASVPESGRQRSDGTLRATIWGSQLVDLDADGRAEVIAFVAHHHAAARTVAGRGAGPDGAAASTSLGAHVVCLTSWGALRWAFDPRITLTFAGRRFDGPWRPSAWLVPVVNSQRRLWVSFYHEIWWPSFLVAIDASGAAVIEYGSAGHMYALAHLDRGTTPLVLAGGVNNEYAAASMAALDASGPPSASPQTSNGAYFCDTCPPGRPARYFLFPRSELNRLSGAPYNHTRQIQVGDSQVQVSVSETDDVRIVYTFSRTLDVESAGMSDSYWEEHRRLEHGGRLTHSVDHCEEYTKGMPVRMWSAATGWTTVWARQANAAAVR